MSIEITPGYTTTGIVVSSVNSTNLKVRVPEFHGSSPDNFSHIENYDELFIKDEDLPTCKVQKTSESDSYKQGDLVYVTYPTGKSYSALVTGLAKKYSGADGSGEGNDGGNNGGEGTALIIYDKETSDSISKQAGYPVKVNTYISSGYGYRIHPVTGGNKLHAGIDIGVFSGTPVYAILDGVLVEKKVNGSWGGHIVISHGKFNGKQFWSGYAHIKEFADIKLRSQVKKGDFIGYSGGALNDPNHGSSTGAHLHFELWVPSYNGTGEGRENPASYLTYFGKGSSGTQLNWKG